MSCSFYPNCIVKCSHIKDGINYNYIILFIHSCFCVVKIINCYSIEKERKFKDSEAISNIKTPHKMSSQEKTPQEKTPQKSPVEKTPHPILGLVEKTHHVIFRLVEKTPQLKKPSFFI